MSDTFKATESLKIFGVVPNDPGYIYVIRSGPRLKIGCSKSKKSRLREAKTWLPDGEVIGIKPFWNHRELEKYLQLGLAMFWYKGEWYEFEGDEFEEHFLVEFKAFNDFDINRNSINCRSSDLI